MDERPAASTEPSGVDDAGWDVLVADDDVDFATGLQDLLSLELRCPVDAVFDGAAALQRMASAPPDVAILDVRMPQVGGIALARSARRGAARHPFGQPLLIGVTGHQAADVVAEMLDSFDHVVAKPLDASRLLQLIRAHRQGRRRRSTQRFELSSVLGRAVGEALPVLDASRIDVGFDYDGPFAAIEDDAAALRGGIYRVLCGVADLVTGGSALVNARARPLPDGSCQLELIVPATGKPGTWGFDEAIRRLGLSERALSEPTAVGSLRWASGPCPVTGGRVTLLERPGEGVMLRYDKTWPVQQTLGAAVGLASEQRAWIVGAGPMEGASLARRLVRLGWRVARRDSLETLASDLDEVASAPSPCLVLLFGADGDRPASPTLPPSCRCVRVRRRRSRTAPEEDECALGYAPLATAELQEITRQAAALANRSGERTHRAEPIVMRADEAAQVLVVDDGEVNRLMASGLLALLGYRSEEAVSGLDALDHCRHAPPDAVLMDVDMPVLDGIAATRSIRELQRRGELPPFPIIAATANDDAETAARCLAAGMDAVLVKPLSRERLHLALKAAGPGMVPPV